MEEAWWVDTYSRVQWNDIGEGGASEVARALQRNSSITTLDLGVRGVMCLVTAM